MAEITPINPKAETGMHHNQRYTITYDPNAPAHERWVWQVDFTRTYKFFGACPTADAAKSRAFRRIMHMIEYTIEAEENE